MLISLLKMVILHSCWGTELCKLPWDPSLLHQGLARDFFTEKNTICGANSYQNHLIPQQMLAVCAVLDNLSKEHLVLPFASPHRHLAWFLNGLPGISWENLRSLFLLHRILGCCNTARRTCIRCRMNCYWADKPRMWLVESRGEGEEGLGSDLVAEWPFPPGKPSWTSHHMLVARSQFQCVTPGVWPGLGKSLQCWED